MSSGLHGDTPASAAAVVSMLQRHPGLRAHLAREPYIDRRYRVPYLAGASQDGGAVYVDAETPERLPKSQVEPDRWYADHEMFEWWAMTRLGLPYDRAHPLAHGFERMRMRLAGMPDEQIEAYEAESAAMVKIDEAVKLPPDAYPRDLYLGPYESDEDALDERLLPLLRAARFIGAAA